MEHTESSMGRSTEPNMMNEDIFAGWWKQKRGMIRSWWGRLTDDDLERVAGQKDKLVGMLQERYGYTREMAQQEIERRVNEFRDETPGSSASGTGIGHTVRETAEKVSQRTSQAAGEVKARAQELGSSVADRANETTSAVGKKMSSLASTIRQSAPQEGTVGTAATAVADRLEATGSYLQDKGIDNMLSDVTTLIRRYPIQSLLIGVGIGYLMARNRGER
jgi:uncharacterized protein YjbJ (UPF0337 family)